jgi:hypothetical protein
MPLTTRQALAHEGECVTVEGRAHVVADPLRLGTDIVLDRPGQFEGYIPSGDEGSYPGLRGIEGREVDISGVIQFYNAIPEIKMFQVHQLSMAPPPGAPWPQHQC